MTTKIKAKYVGDGFLTGIPARDLSVTVWAGLTEAQREAALKSGLYELVEAGASTSSAAGKKAGKAAKDKESE